MDLLFYVHLLSSLMMLGVIWFVQIIHYPLFLNVPEDSFQDFEQRHTKLAGLLIAPLMLTELGTAIWLVFSYGFDFNALSNLILLLGIWASTFFIQVPLHEDLNQVYSLEKIKKLISTNWIRTVFWSLRAIILVIWLHGFQ
ncbi:MAG: hypothetical protein MRZ79_10655 [Bacteroidia bacterium]|nr:hypothetical protein [Bacteroidia bacterium]